MASNTNNKTTGNSLNQTIIDGKFSVISPNKPNSPPSEKFFLKNRIYQYIMMPNPGKEIFFVYAENKKHIVGTISTENGAPSFAIDSKVQSKSGEIIKLKLEDGGSLIEVILKGTIDAYKKATESTPPSLPGSLADQNLANFQKEFIKLKVSNPSLSDAEIGNIAIGKISFGNHRAKLGYGNLKT